MDASIRLKKRPAALGALLLLIFGLCVWPYTEEDVAAAPQHDQLRLEVTNIAPPGEPAQPQPELHHKQLWDGESDPHAELYTIEYADGRRRVIDKSIFEQPGYGKAGLLSFFCMTALPERLSTELTDPPLTEVTVRDLVQQGDGVVLTIPRSKTATQLPSWISKQVKIITCKIQDVSRSLLITHSHTDTSINLHAALHIKYENRLIVVRPEIDYGPSSRIIGCMFAVPEKYGDKVAMIEVDDDEGYPPNFAEGFLRYLEKDPTGAFSLSGFNAMGQVGEPGPSHLHEACRDQPSLAGDTKCTVEANILEGFMGLAVMRKYLKPELLRVGQSDVSKACYYGDDAYVSFSLRQAGATPRVVFDPLFNAFTFNRYQKTRTVTHQKMYCLTSKVPGLQGSCPNGEAYALCEQWFRSNPPHNLPEEP